MLGRRAEAVPTRAPVSEHPSTAEDAQVRGPRPRLVSPFPGGPHRLLSEPCPCAREGDRVGQSTRCTRWACFIGSTRGWGA